MACKQAQQGYSIDVPVSMTLLATSCFCHGGQKENDLGRVTFLAETDDYV